VAVGCGRDDDAGDASVTGEEEPRSSSDARRPGGESRPALCSALGVRVTGRVATPAASELSGMALSRSQPGVLWTHNDSGDSARVLALAEDGRLRAELEVPSSSNRDWEEIAIAREPGGDGDALYIGDIGDNLARRSEIAVYVVPEPQGGDRMSGATAPAQRIALRYPDGAHDAEALLVDPLSGALAIVTKSFGGRARVYTGSPRAHGRAGTQTLGQAGSLSLGPGEAVTAGSVSATGRTVVLRSYGHAYVWTRRPRESLAGVLRRAPCVAGAGLISEGQGEAVAVSGDGRALYTVAEGERPPVRRYAAPGPPPP